jgi:predicted RNA-binding protein with PIN domain
MMRRKYLIDGYNLLHQFEELRRQMEYNLEGAREGLLIRLSAFALAKSADVSVVFDGGRETVPPDGPWRGIRIYFSRPPQKADPMIKKMIADRKKGEDLVIVSSDREIETYARLCGVKVETSKAFAIAMQKNPSTEMERKINHTLSEREVEEWMTLFRKKPGEKDNH